MNKKSSICQCCYRKTDHRIQYKGRAICKNCLDWVSNKKTNIVQTQDGLMEIK